MAISVTRRSRFSSSSVSPPSFMTFMTLLGLVTLFALVTTAQAALVPSRQAQTTPQQTTTTTTGNNANNAVEWCGADFLCYDGSTCVDGPPNFDDHILPDGTVLAIHQVDELMIKHCECTAEWTGLQCDVPVANCGSDHYCYNGGTCIGGLNQVHSDDQLFCDCSAAFDVQGNHYVGKNCEQKVETFCDSTKANFCLNDGICNPNYPWNGEPCQCVNGYQGAHCEYKASTVPECNTPCQNGACTLGVHPDGAIASKQLSPFEFCACADNWTGDFCEIESVPCGDRSCYHGSVCVQRVVDNEAVFHCDCRETDNGITAYAGRFCEFQATSFCLPNNNSNQAGGAAAGSNTGSSLNGNLFCVNNGTCRDDPYMGCSCPDQYSGFSCEFEVAGPVLSQPTTGTTTTTTTTATSTTPAVVNMTCDLDCGEHGVCRNGLKDNSALGDAVNAAHLNLTDDGSFQHCVCQDGYVGILCDHVVEVCPDGQHKCLHGSTCVQQGQDYLCDCQDVNVPPPPTANGEVLSSYAGDSCEHPATSTCLLDPQNGPAKPLSFCVNNGVCNQMVGPNDAHQGCTCPPGWTGPHCEVRDQPPPTQTVPQPTQPAPLPVPVPVPAPTQQVPLSAAQPPQPGAGPTPEPPRQPTSFVPNRSGTPTNNTQSANLNKGVAGVIVVITLAFVVLVTGLFCCRFRQNSRKFKSADITKAVEWSDNRYRDNPPEQVNLAPRRASAFIETDGQAPNNTSDQEDVYMASIASPSRDPMATQLAPAPSEPDKDETQGPQVYIGPPRDEDGHVLHSVEII